MIGQTAVNSELGGQSPPLPLVPTEEQVIDTLISEGKDHLSWERYSRYFHNIMDTRGWKAGHIEYVYTNIMYGECTMASKTRMQKKAKTEQAEIKKADWIGFVQCELSTSDKEAIVADETDLNDLIDWQDGLLSLGYKFSQTMDFSNHSYIATVTGAYNICPNAGYAVNGRGKNAYMALKALWWKVEKLLPNNWTDYEPEDGDILG